MKNKRRSFVLAPPSSDSEPELHQINGELNGDASDNSAQNSDNDDQQNGSENEPETMETEEDAPKPPKKKKAGIIYLSSIPKHMNVAIVRDLFSEYGEVGRIFLQPEKKFEHMKKKKNSKKPLAIHFTEGWVEFKIKRVAKKVAEFLNTKPITTKKGSRFCDVLWSIKYLPRFKWIHLSERLTYEKAVYKQKLQAEISQARKEASFFQNSLDKSERLKKNKKKSKVKVAEGDK